MVRFRRRRNQKFTLTCTLHSLSLCINILYNPQMPVGPLSHKSYDENKVTHTLILLVLKVIHDDHHGARISVKQ